jgi:hypothetical protein
LLHLARSKAAISIDDAAALYNNLDPVTVDFLLGDWKGSIPQTGHPDLKFLQKMGWAGKRFNFSEDINPEIIQSDDGLRRPKIDLGAARVRAVARGVVSAAMIYDQLPIIDYFRYLNENAVIGVTLGCISFWSELVHMPSDVVIEV